MFIRFAVFVMFSFCCVPLLPLDSKNVRNSALIGSVIDDNGFPVQSHIAAFHLGVQEGRVIPETGCSETTDADGRFQCRNLLAGAYLIVADTFRRDVSANQKPSKNDSADRLPLFAVYPENTDLDPASFLRLFAGETRSVEILISSDSAPEFQVKSATRIVDSKAMAVNLQGDEFAVPTAFRIKPNPKDGNYKVREISPGYYRLSEIWSTSGMGYEAQTFTTAAQLSSGNESLTEIKDYTVSGSIQYADSAPSAEPEVVLRSASLSDFHRYVAAIDKNGVFTFSGVVSGKYYVSFNGGKGMYVSDVLVGGRSANGAPIVVDEGVSGLSLTVVAKSASGSIAGTMELDGSEPKPGILVQSLDFHTSQIVSVDAQGSFKVTGLAPGQYLLYGWADIESAAYDSPQFLRRYTNKALSVDLDDGSAQTGLTVECNQAAL